MSVNFLVSDGEQCLVDVAMLRYRNIEALVELSIANGLQIDDVPGLDLEIILPEVAVEPVTSLAIVKFGVQVKDVEAWEDQAAVDLAMQEGGTVESLVDFLALNGIGLTDDLTIGQRYKKPVVVDAKVTGVFNTIRRPASSYTVPVEQLPEKLEGIDYWRIEDDFVVQ